MGYGIKHDKYLLQPCHMLYNFFAIFYNKEKYFIQPLRMLPDHIHYEISKDDKVIFYLEHIVKEGGDGCWSIVGHYLVDEKMRDLSDAIGSEIELYTLGYTNKC